MNLNAAKIIRSICCLKSKFASNIQIFQIAKKLISGNTKVILSDMKTAISIPDDVFELSEKLAKKLKVSRSRIFAMGVKKLGEEIEKEDITAKLNDYYSKEKAEIDPVIMKMAALSLPKEEW